MVKGGRTPGVRKDGLATPGRAKALSHEPNLPERSGYEQVKCSCKSGPVLHTRNLCSGTGARPVQCTWNSPMSVYF